MKSTRQLRHNIKSLLRARRQTQHDLAFFCRRSDAWISKVLSDDEDSAQKLELRIVYLDRIADFFGLEMYQLFQPGISPLTERRKVADRRVGRDRRAKAQVPGAIHATDLRLTGEDVSDLLLLRSLGRTMRGEIRQQMDEYLRGRTPRRKPSTAAAERVSDPQRHAASGSPGSRGE